MGNSKSSDPLALLLPIFFIGVLTAVGIVGWQLYSYLRSGAWPSLSIMSVLLWLDVDWARAPSDWVGVHKLLSQLPLSLAFLVAGVAPVLAWSWWEDANR